jgi:hypothetical protein
VTQDHSKLLCDRAAAIRVTEDKLSERAGDCCSDGFTRSADASKVMGTVAERSSGAVSGRTGDWRMRGHEPETNASRGADPRPEDEKTASFPNAAGPRHEFRQKPTCFHERQWRDDVRDVWRNSCGGAGMGNSGHIRGAQRPHKGRWGA